MSFTDLAAIEAAGWLRWIEGASTCPTTRAPTHINLAEKLGEFSEHWAPKIVARYNDNEVRLVKTDGELVWHKHDETDELFLILEGEFDMDFRDRTVTVGRASC